MIELLAAIEDRFARLEAAVRPFSIGSIDEKTHLNRIETALFLGKSPSTIIRKQKVDPRFPKPDFVDGQYVWKVSALRAYKLEGQFQKR